MRIKIVGTILLLIIAAAGVTRAQSGPEGRAAIYVYALPASVVGNLRRSVYLDDKIVADIQPKRYFIILAEPGMHQLHFKDKKWGGIEKEFKANTIYYLRAGWNEGGWTVKPRGLDLVAPENGAFDVKQLKPIDTENIKNDKSVVLEL